MRNGIPIPGRASSEVQLSFQVLQQQLNNASIDTIRDKKNLSHIKESQSAFYQENGNLYLYRKQGGKLYRFQAGEDVPTRTPSTVQVGTGRSDSDIEDLINDLLTALEIKTRYESNDDTNAFTDTLLTKLGSLEALRNAQQTFDLIESLLDTLIADYGEPFTSTLLAKLNTIDAGATGRRWRRANH